MIFELFLALGILYYVIAMILVEFGGGSYNDPQRQFGWWRDLNSISH